MYPTISDSSLEPKMLLAWSITPIGISELATIQLRSKSLQFGVSILIPFRPKFLLIFLMTLSPRFGIFREHKAGLANIRRKRRTSIFFDVGFNDLLFLVLLENEYFSPPAINKLCVTTLVGGIITDRWQCHAAGQTYLSVSYLGRHWENFSFYSQYNEGFTGNASRM